MSETLFSLFPTRKNGPQVCFGLPFPEACRNHVLETFLASKVYIISSASLAKKTDALTRLQSALGSKVAVTRIGMRPHTQWSEILEIVQDAQAVKADLLITLGAGSLTDAAKIIALAIANNASTFDDLAALPFDSPTKKVDMKAPNVPIISIPTSLSGGEYSDNAGGTNDRTHRKHSFAGPTKGPALVILDAALTTSTPPSVWLSTGLRAVDHCVEALCSLQGKPEADQMAEKGLQLLLPGLLGCKENSNNLEARHKCQMGVIEAMKALGFGVPMGASHAIGHQLGPLGVGHGETSCILLPAVCKFNAAHNANVERQQKVLDILWKVTEVQQVAGAKELDEKTASLADVLDAFIRELGLPRSLGGFGIGKEKINGLAETSLHDRWSVTNPVPLKEKSQVIEILEMVL